MSKLETTHSPAEDWHPEDIKAEIRKRCGSVAALAQANGYEKPRTFLNVLRMKYPKVEAIIADAIGVPAAEIWPSRYQDPIKIRPLNHRSVA
ncbi:Uncharacterised protein [BD1-7 clade bacterium]|uniref:Ner winged helix-turn-helix DNA-binding domain-containing protein n=1 Tax=BD1-7 clade bacterium TaxID=2029982 RepID=A0A5S9Q1Y4_9GAMM|nr:Uncharacterised protein [BD1-7 clade bacterium]CAA0111914.1 Uncharacterised protein [BD1-7 clade bacterium]